MKEIADYRDIFPNGSPKIDDGGNIYTVGRCNSGFHDIDKLDEQQIIWLNQLFSNLEEANRQ